MPNPTLSGALSAIVPILSGLQVDFDFAQWDGSVIHVHKEIARVYRLPPPADVELETPCWMNIWRFSSEVDGMGSATSLYEIKLTLFVEEGPETDILAETGTQLHDALLVALRGNLRLVDSANQVNATNGLKIRGAESTLGMINWNGKPYVALQYFITFDQWVDVNFG